MKPTGNIRQCFEQTNRCYQVPISIQHGSIQQYYSL
uniref:Uncharacterized protein n=1 Tax=Arundo donax TaxID=35708 RepID=A0A0A8XRY0_ARUDO